MSMIYVYTYVNTQEISGVTLFWLAFISTKNLIFEHLKVITTIILYSNF